MISYIKLFNYLLKAQKENDIIFFTFSAYQISLLNYLIRKERYYKKKSFLIFDFNKTEVGRLQVKKLCSTNKKIYLGSVDFLKILIITLISKFKGIRIIHGYYYGKSFKLISLIYKKNLCGLEDGSNTALMPLIMNTKFLEFYTIFPSLLNSKKINEICKVKYLRYPNKNKICFSPIKECTEAYICGSPFVEKRFVNYHLYLDYLEFLIDYEKLKNIKRFFYYPHRKEEVLKLEEIKNKFKINIIEPTVPFDIYLKKIKKNSLIITNNSTLERSILYQNNDLSQFKLLPIRFDPIYIKRNFNLKYLILSSSLAYGLKRKDLLLYSNKKFFNYDEILNNKNIFDHHFKNIESSFIRKIIDNNRSKIKIENWVGQPLIYKENQDKIYIWRNISNLSSLKRYCKLCPSTMIGKQSNV